MLTDVRHLLRRLGRSPLFTAIALLTLAVGIGANTAIFSVIYGVLLKPLPFHDPERLVAVWQAAPGLNIKELNASPSSYFTYREESRVFTSIALWQHGSESVTGAGDPEHVESLVVTNDLFEVLGVKPLRGRTFNEEETRPKGADATILTYGYWQRRFGGDPDVIGRKLVIDGRSCEIVGILPRDFRFIQFKPELIMPLRFNRAETFLGNFSYQSIARLKPGVTLQQANADVGRMIGLMMRKFPPAPGLSLKMFEDTHMAPNVKPLDREAVGDIGKVLWVLMATVGMVLFIACANVANLLLVRAEGRQQELAVRTAMGASPWRIARDLLLESAALGIAGGVLGLALAWAGLRALVALGPRQLPRLDEIGIDGHVLLFTVLVSLASGILFGLAPVFKFAGPRILAAMREGGRGGSQSRERHRLRNGLVIVQVAMALMLLVSSGLMLRSMIAMRQVQPGFTSPEELLAVRISIPDGHVKEPERVALMEQQMIERLAALPGVTSVALASGLPMDGSSSNDPIFVEDRPNEANSLPPIRRYKNISPGFFQTLGGRLLAGRDVTWTDIHQKRPVVILSQNLARDYWPSPAAAIGKRVRENTTGHWREVIGVVDDVREDGVDKPAPGIAYWPLMTAGFWGEGVRIQRWVKFAIRSPRAGSASFLSDVQKAIWSVDANLPLFQVETQQTIYDRSMARTSFTLVMLSIAAAMALLLGVVGIYGVVSYLVTHRTREIGIRMALGATQQSVRRLFLLHGLSLTAIGLAIGITGAIACTRLMSALLFSVSPRDPVTYLAVPLVLTAATLLATYLPARRATLIEPVEALRSE